MAKSDSVMRGGSVVVGKRKENFLKMEKIGERYGVTTREELPGNVYVNTIPTISQKSLIKYVLFIYL